jgi:hypothetical protein
MKERGSLAARYRASRRAELAQAYAAVRAARWFSTSSGVARTWIVAAGRVSVPLAVGLLPSALHVDRDNRPSRSSMSKSSGIAVVACSIAFIYAVHRQCADWPLVLHALRLAVPVLLVL